MFEPRGTARTDDTVDVRTRRRLRGRAAVTDAMIDLVLAGHLPPSVEQLADRSGVSIASIFRYFDGLDDLRRAATELYFERYEHLFEVPDIGEGTLPERIARLVDVRLRLYDVAGPVGRLVRLRAHDDPTARENLTRLRNTFTDQLRHHFHDELSVFDPELRVDLVGVMTTLTSFESWEQLRDHERWAASDIRRAWTSTLTHLLAVVEIPPPGPGWSNRYDPGSTGTIGACRCTNTDADRVTTCSSFVVR